MIFSFILKAKEPSMAPQRPRLRRMRDQVLRLRDAEDAELGCRTCGRSFGSDL